MVDLRHQFRGTHALGHLGEALEIGEEDGGLLELMYVRVALGFDLVRHLFRQDVVQERLGDDLFLLHGLARPVDVAQPAQKRDHKA